MKAGLLVRVAGSGSLSHSVVRGVSNNFQSKAFLHEYLISLRNSGLV